MVPFRRYLLCFSCGAVFLLDCSVYCRALFWAETSKIILSFHLFEYRMLLANFEEVQVTVRKTSGDKNPYAHSQIEFHKGWEMPQILRNQKNQALVRLRARVLLRHWQVWLVVLWKSDCCVLRKAEAAPVSSLLWQRLVFSGSLFPSLDLQDFHVCRQHAQPKWYFHSSV